MVAHNEALMGIESEARKIFGDNTAEWMTRPSRLLDGMAPAELAITPEGARVVLHELEQEKAVLKAKKRSRHAQAQQKQGYGQAVEVLAR